MTTLTVESIKKDLADGLKYKEIADKNGVPLSSVQYVAKLSGYRRNKRVTPEITEAMKADRASGMGVKELSVKYGYSFSMISRLTKKSPEAPTPMENASEDITDSGSAADTNIITDVPEVVKQEEIPGVVVDALLEKIQNISTKIDTEEKYLAALKADKKSLERWYHENCTAFGRDYKRRNNHAAE